MSRWLPLIAAVAVTLTASAPAAAQQTEEFSWSGTLATGKSIEVRGINGGIDAAPAPGRTVTVSAIKKGRKSDPAEVRIEVIENGDGILVCAVYPDKRGNYDECDRRGRHGHNMKKTDVEVDFTIGVPSGVDFVGGTVNGGIDAEGLGSNVRVHTVNGGITVSGTGTVEASTVNGSIDARAGTGNWSGTLEFRTVNGSITVTLPEGTNAVVEAETVNGGLMTDFPLTISSGRRWGPRKIEGTIGSGGGRLELETVNGAINIRKS